MGRVKQPRILLFAVTALWGACLVSANAFAAPPLNKMAAQLLHGGPISSSGPSAPRLPSSRLDLAPPLVRAERVAGSEFPITPRRGLAVESMRMALPSLGAAPSGTQPAARIMSRPEMLARNFKREGLPIAKLFQSENSLVHIGLNSKGKPGLWIVEKLH